MHDPLPALLLFVIVVSLPVVDLVLLLVVNARQRRMCEGLPRLPEQIERKLGQSRDVVRRIGPAP